MQISEVRWSEDISITVEGCEPRRWVLQTGTCIEWNSIWASQQSALHDLQLESQSNLNMIIYSKVAAGILYVKQVRVNQPLVQMLATYNIV